jgi:hypothetical protein
MRMMHILCDEFLHLSGPGACVYFSQLSNVQISEWCRLAKGCNALSISERNSKLMPKFPVDFGIRPWEILKLLPSLEGRVDQDLCESMNCSERPYDKGCAGK